MFVFMLKTMRRHVVTPPAFCPRNNILVRCKIRIGDLSSPCNKVLSVVVQFYQAGVKNKPWRSRKKINTDTQTQVDVWSAYGYCVFFRRHVRSLDKTVVYTPTTIEFCSKWFVSGAFGLWAKYIHVHVHTYIFILSLCVYLRSVYRRADN